MSRPVLWHWPPALDAELIRRFLADVPVKVIAHDMSRPAHAVQMRVNHLREAGKLPYRGRPWTAAEDRLLIALRADGVSYGEIGKRIGRSRTATKMRRHLLKSKGLAFTDRDQLTLELGACPEPFDCLAGAQDRLHRRAA